MRAKASNLRTFLSLSGGTFLLLLLINLGLPALLLLLRVPSFAIGDGPFWLLRWENTAARSGIEFNLLLLFIIAIAVGLIGLIAKQRQH
jgi:hypothetical protein